MSRAVADPPQLCFLEGIASFTDGFLKSSCMTVACVEEKVSALQQQLADPRTSLSERYRILFSLRNLPGLAAHQAILKGKISALIQNTASGVRDQKQLGNLKGNCWSRDWRLNCLQVLKKSLTYSGMRLLTVWDKDVTLRPWTLSLTS